ncbi:hypothetical protein CEV31_4299 [Brucella thiophenivorans]|uniref:Uncharacterized protein n=1 Tax=Brucella thiophenivorans TaxID=571255 RepID=A0A256FTU6_9HYPH|nr:hypothetical protein CEV31_4299 [Brucella thiophenivorans]
MEHHAFACKAVKNLERAAGVSIFSGHYKNPRLNNFTIEKAASWRLIGYSSIFDSLF